MDILTKHVLVVEDNDVDYLLLLDLLEDIPSERFDVEWVNTIDAARKALNRGQYDICFVDHDLGGHKGLTLIEERTTDHPPFILLTGSKDPEVDIAATKAGARTYLQKGHFDRELLERSIRYAIENAKREATLLTSLKQSHLLTTTVSNLTDGIIVTDAQGIDNPIVFANAAFCVITGYSQQEILGRNCRFLQGEETDPQTVRQIREALQEQRPFNGVVLNYHKDGTPFWNGLKLTPIFDVDGKLINFVGLQSDITARRQAEIAIYESEARKAAILEAALYGIITIDHNNTVVEFNAAAEKIFGYSRDEAVGRSVDELVIPPVLREGHRQSLSIAEEGGTFLGRWIELVSQRADGTKFPAELAITRIQAGGSPLSTGYVRDITERKQAEESLRRSEANLRAAQEIAHLGSWELDLTEHQSTDQNSLRWSDEVFHVLGYQPGEIEVSNERFLQAVHPEDRRRVQAMLLRAMKGDEPYDIDHRILLPDGTARVIHSQAGIIRDEESNAALRMVGTVQDITERKHAEEASARLAAIVESSEDAIISKTLDGVITTWNTGAEKLYGYTAEEAIGRSISMLVPSDLPNEMSQLLDQIRRGVSVKQYETVRVCKDGQRLDISLSISPLRDGEGNIIGASSIKRDITERKRAEKDLHFQKTLLEAQTEASLDGILVVSQAGHIVSYNQRLLQMWDIPPHIVAEGKDAPLLEAVLSKVATPQQFSEKVAYLYDHQGERSYDEINLLNGLIFDRYSAPISSSGGSYYGRVWYFHDVTERKQHEASLRQANDELEARVAARTAELERTEGEAHRRARYHEGIADFGKQALNNIDLDMLLNGMVSLVASTLQVEVCSFWGLIPHTNTLRLRAMMGFLAGRDMEDTEIGNSSQVGYSALTQETVIVENLKQETRFQAWLSLLEMGVTSMVTVPVKDGSFYGILAIASRREQKFSSHDIYFLQAIANVLASAIARQRAEAEIHLLNSNLQGVNDELRANEARLLQGNRILADLTRLRATEYAKLQEALHQVTEAGSQMLDVERCSVWTFNENGTTLRCLDQYERQAHHHSEGIELEEDASYFPAVKDHRMVIANDAQNDPITTGFAKNYLIPNGITSILDIALVVAGKPIGVLCCEHIGEARQWQTEDQTFASAMASACSLVLESYQRAVAESALRLAKDEAEQARQEAERANLAKSEFLSRMSHELRTPLNSILGFGQILNRQELTPIQTESVGYILKGGHHLLTLINEVLDIARVEAGHIELSIEPLDLANVVADCCVLVRPLANGSNIRLLDKVSGLWSHHVLADRQRLKQVLINLLANAIKYNRPDGEVVISATEITPVQSLSSRMQIRVSDSGLGLTAQDMEKLFTPFERLNAANSQIEGTGLGLVLSQRLATAMGGTLGAESTLGQGSTFWVELPKVDSPLEVFTALLEQPTLEEPREVKRTYTVLSIEDNLSNVRLLEAIFESRPEITLLAATQGSMGLELAREHQPDVILLDLNLPGLSGSEVLSQLQQSEITREIPVIVVSADATPKQIERLLAAGVRAYLTKPLNVDEFLATLDNVLAMNGTKHEMPDEENVR